MGLSNIPIQTFKKVTEIRTCHFNVAFVCDDNSLFSLILGFVSVAIGRRCCEATAFSQDLNSQPMLNVWNLSCIKNDFTTTTRRLCWFYLVELENVFVVSDCNSTRHSYIYIYLYQTSVY